MTLTAGRAGPKITCAPGARARVLINIIHGLAMDRVYMPGDGTDKAGGG